MSRPTAARDPGHSRSRVPAAVASGVALAVTAGAFIWPGFDARDVPPDDASVWALQTGDGWHYGRVNTELGELDTVKRVDSPSTLVQSGNTLLVYAGGNGKVARMSSAMPLDIETLDAEGLTSTPAGTSAPQPRHTLAYRNFIRFVVAAAGSFISSDSRIGGTPKSVQRSRPEGEPTTPPLMTATTPSADTAVTGSQEL